VYTSLAVATAFTCAQTITLELRCWGSGDNEWMPRFARTPVLIASGFNFVLMTAGVWHACGLTAGGDAYCWGGSNGGALGNGTLFFRAIPTLVSGGHKWVSIAAGGDETCGVTDAGRMYCWGANSSGQLGNGSTTSASQPIEVLWPTLRSTPPST
jgi:alpha-tubulin suppressor-like RCC1 family protein